MSAPSDVTYNTDEDGVRWRTDHLTGQTHRADQVPWDRRDGDQDHTW